MNDNPLACYTETRRAFIEVVHWINSESPSLSKDALAAFQELHKMWKDTSMATPVQRFWKMKDKHEILNAELESSSLWQAYISSSMKFRLCMMAARIPGAAW